MNQNKEILNHEKVQKNQHEKMQNKSIFYQKTLPLNNIFPKKNYKKAETMCVVGPNGIGKSVFSILFAQEAVNKKSIIIDFDVLNNSLQTLLGIKKYEEKIKNGIKRNDLVYHELDISKYIIKTKYNIDLLSGLNLIFDEKYKLSYKKIRRIVEKLKQNYDLIIFDTSTETLLDYTKEIMNEVEKIIFISGANMLEVRKSERLLRIYEEDWNINRSKINIVFNRCTNNSIDESVLRDVFKNYNVLGKIMLSEYYDLVINKNMKQKSKLRKEIEKIKKEIIKEKYNGACK